MAETLRHTLNAAAHCNGQRATSPAAIGLASVPVALVFAPILPGLYWALSSAWDVSVWLRLWSEPQWPQALASTLTSSLLSTLLACTLAATLATLAYPGARWRKLQAALAPLLSMPHAAFAVGLFFLFAPSGWLVRWLAWPLGWTDPPAWVTVQDPYGLSLALALAIKESWFLLWALAAVLGEAAVAQQMRVARSLGYNPVQVWRQVLWPVLLPRLSWPVAAVFAYGLSVVDMALILGPSTPPTLAVLAWRWLSDPDPGQQALGSAASVLLMLMLLAAGMVARGVWQIVAVHPIYPTYPTGRRQPLPRWHRVRVHPWVLGTGYAVLAVLLLWSLADSWFFPALWPDRLVWQTWTQADWTPFLTTVWLAGAVSLLGLPSALLWLEWGPQHLNTMLYLPLILPALPLVAGQYAVLLHLGLDGNAAALIWSHLLWVLPYMVLMLAGPYHQFDARLTTTAQALGRSRLGACLTVKWPLLLRPILAALAVGIAVSVAQYLPTLFAGGGRFATVTTEAVALSAGGNRRTLALMALLQITLPLATFALAAGVPLWASRQRLGLR